MMEDHQAAQKERDELQQRLSTLRGTQKRGSEGWEAEKARPSAFFVPG